MITATELRMIRDIHRNRERAAAARLAHTIAAIQGCRERMADVDARIEAADVQTEADVVQYMFAAQTAAHLAALPAATTLRRLQHADYRHLLEHERHLLEAEMQELEIGLPGHRDAFRIASTKVEKLSVVLKKTERHEAQRVEDNTDEQVMDERYCLEQRNAG